ncbi:hypothetical protein RWX45_01400 [Actinomyces sp. MRS3W]|nr:hypothetical protein [Actinomyces sp. MRS3W]
MALTFDVPVAYRNGADRARFVMGLLAGGELLTVHQATITDVTDLVAAQQAADDAAAVAVTAKAAADSAAAAALGAQATADAATAKATTASGLYTVSAATPTASDGQGKPTGAIWEVRSGGTSLRRYVWGGSSWTQIKAGQDYIADKAIGRAQIGDAAVGTAQIADASITDAKIGSLSVSKLTVTDGATIPVAVMQAILADSAFLGKVLATSLTVTSDNLLPDPYYDLTSSTWVGSIANRWDTTTTYQGHPYAYRMPQNSAGASNMTVYGAWLGNANLAPCTPGDRLLASSMWYADGAMPTTGAGFSTQVYFYDSSKTMISGASGNQTAGPRVALADHPVGEWFKVGGEVPVTVPDGAAYMSVRPTLYFTAGTTPTSAVAWVGHVDLHRQTPAVDITDGAVTAAKIQASEEMWAKIGAFAAVTTDMLTAGEATITGTAVVGDLIGNTLRGGSLSLLDQEAASNTATALWKNAKNANNLNTLFSTLRYSLTTSDTGVVVTATAGESTTGLFADSVNGHFPEVGPTFSVGPITLTATFKPNYAAKGVALKVLSNENRWYSSGGVDVAAGSTVTLRVTIPEGEWWNQNPTIGDFSSLKVLLGTGMTAGKTATVSNITVSWPRILTTGLQIFRDETGLARIDISDSEGNITTLSSRGATVRDTAGAAIGTVTWRNLVTPPLAYALSTTSQSLTGNTWVTGSIVGGTMKLAGGVTNNSSHLVIPESGFYRLTGRAKFASDTTGRRGVGFSINSGAANTNTFALPASGTHTVECNALMALNAGDTIALSLYQNSGGNLSSPERELSIQYVTSV